MTAITSRLGSADVTILNDTEFRITRRFDAPAERVFEVWTTPDHVRRWWTDDATAPLSECEIDLRVGGRWRYAIDTPDGAQLAWHGTYQEIVPGRRLVSTEVFEGFPDAEALNTLTLEEHEGTTTLVVVVRHQSKANRDGHLQSGMEAGMQQALDRVERLLAAG